MINAVTLQDWLCLFVVLAGIVAFLFVGTVFMATRAWWRTL
jgi:hypothetical protein